MFKNLLQTDNYIYNERSHSKCCLCNIRLNDSIKNNGYYGSDNVDYYYIEKFNFNHFNNYKLIICIKCIDNDNLINQLLLLNYRADKLKKLDLIADKLNLLALKLNK